MFLLCCFLFYLNQNISSCCISLYHNQYKNIVLQYANTLQSIYEICQIKIERYRQKIIIVLSLDSTVCFYFNLNTTALYYAAQSNIFTKLKPMTFTNLD